MDNTTTTSSPDIISFFSRIYIFTPSGLVDDSLKPIKHYIENTLKHDVKKEGPYIFEDLDPKQIQSILKKQEKIHDMLKNKVYADKSWKGKKWLPQIWIIISDHADNPRAVHRAGGILETLFGGLIFAVSTRGLWPQQAYLGSSEFRFFIYFFRKKKIFFS